MGEINLNRSQNFFLYCQAGKNRIGALVEAVLKELDFLMAAYVKEDKKKSICYVFFSSNKSTHLNIHKPKNR